MLLVTLPWKVTLVDLFAELTISNNFPLGTTGETPANIGPMSPPRLFLRSMIIPLYVLLVSL